MCGVDGIESYRPESKMVIDIVSGYMMFARQNAKTTLQLVTAAARKICASWNAEHSSEEASNIFIFVST